MDRSSANGVSLAISRDPAGSCGQRNAVETRITDTAANLYLDLLKRCLTRTLFPDESLDEDAVQRMPARLKDREEGRDWPSDAVTMVGLKRLSNVQVCMLSAIRSGVQGDVLEAGTWRGGTAIFMRAILRAYDIRDRIVWVADSFEGLPLPDAERYPLDAGHTDGRVRQYLSVPLETVKANFRSFSLLDDQVRFLPGWFKDTLPTAPIERLAVLRLDGDMYGSTMEVLVNLYDRVSPGGFVIVDDYQAILNCRVAVDDFRRERNIRAPLTRIDRSGVFWQVERGRS